MTYIKNVFPLLYLLLSHHYIIIKAAKTYLLHPNELRDAGKTITLVEDALGRRRDTLRGK